MIVPIIRCSRLQVQAIKSSSTLGHGYRLLSTTSSVNCASQTHDGTSTNDVDHYDIVINGGGVVGFTLLASMSKNPYFADKRILLLEQQQQKKPAHGQEAGHGTEQINAERKISNRVSSITLSSKDFLDNNLNVWSSLASFVKECKSMYVWSDNYTNGITFMPRYPGLSDLTCPYWEPNQSPDDNVCYFVENHRLLAAIESAVSSSHVKYGCSVTDIKSDGNCVSVHIADNNNDSSDGQGKVIRTSLIVGCDGFNSMVRSKSNLKYFHRDLKQKGIVGTVEMMADGNNEVAFQRFLPEDGSVIALLPISDNYSSIVISTHNSFADKLMAINDEDFVGELNNLLAKKSIQKPLKATIRSAIDNVLANVPFLPKSAPPRSLNPPSVASIVSNSRAAFPLMFGTTLPYATGIIGGQQRQRGHGSNLVLIGDALHRVPPLAGQGLNLGIGDAIELSKCLSESLERGEATFDTSTSGRESLTKALDVFERRRQFKLLPMMAGIMSMQCTFTSVPSSLISQFNHFNMIKNELVKFANSR